jgi:hypothetical protein
MKRFALLLCLLAASIPLARAEDWICPAGAVCGGFASLQGRPDPVAAGGTLGVFVEPAPWFAVNVGPRVFSGEEFSDLYGGADAGVEWSVPGRVSPFAGVGGFLGWSAGGRIVDDNGDDDDGDGAVDEPGETAPRRNGVALASLHPAAGVNLWVTKRFRCTLSAQYEVTTAGRRRDFWLFGAGVGFVLP